MPTRYAASALPSCAWTACCVTEKGQPRPHARHTGQRATRCTWYSAFRACDRQHRWMRDAHKCDARPRLRVTYRPDTAAPTGPLRQPSPTCCLQTLYGSAARLAAPPVAAVCTAVAIAAGMREGPPIGGEDRPLRQPSKRRAPCRRRVRARPDSAFRRAGCCRGICGTCTRPQARTRTQIRPAAQQSISCARPHALQSACRVGACPLTLREATKLTRRRIRAAGARTRARQQPRSI